MLQKRAIRTISKSPFDAHTGPIFKELNILSLHNIYLGQIGKIMFQYKAGLLPTCFENIFLLRSQIMFTTQETQITFPFRNVKQI